MWRCQWAETRMSHVLISWCRGVGFGLGWVCCVRLTPFGPTEMRLADWMDWVYQSAVIDVARCICFDVSHSVSFRFWLLTAPYLGLLSYWRTILSIGLAVLCFYSKTGFWPSYCHISSDLDEILYTPIVVRNTLSLVGRLRPRSAHGRLQAKQKWLFFSVIL